MGSSAGDTFARAGEKDNPDRFFGNSYSERPIWRRRPTRTAGALTPSLSRGEREKEGEGPFSPREKGRDEGFRRRAGMRAERG